MKTTTETKHKGITITNTPSEKYPTLVTLTKTPKRATEIQGKKFLTLEHASKFIDQFELDLWEVQTTTRLEKNESRVARKELMKLGGLQLIRLR